MINLAKFPNEIDRWVDFLGLGIVGCSRNCKTPKAQELAIEKGKFVKEIDAPGSFLGLGIDSSSSNYEINHLNPTPLRSNHPTQGYIGCSRNRKISKFDEQGNNLGKEIDGCGVFLGLGVDSSSNYEINHGRALNPTPLLRSFHPTQLGYKDYSSSDNGASSSTCCGGKKRMRGEDKSNVMKKKKGGPNFKRRRVVGEYPEPINPPQELVNIIGPNARPVFLYRKQLSEWDTQKVQNRLFVNDSKKLMDFMSEGERLAVEDHGIDILGFDRNGTKYELHSNKWASLDKVVVNKGWFTILDANKAVKGDWVHLWAFRRGLGGKFCLYVDFRHQP